MRTNLVARLRELKFELLRRIEKEKRRASQEMF
jgi:hypothetical protein